MKPREFWIKLAKYRPQRNVICKTEPHYLGAYGIDDFYEKIHVREVVPIDWEKLWKEYDEILGYRNPKDIITKLVEKQLSGEE